MTPLAYFHTHARCTANLRLTGPVRPAEGAFSAWASQRARLGALLAALQIAAEQ
jgi:hypothetical protein